MGNCDIIEGTEAGQLIDNKLVEVEDIDRALKRYQLNLAMIRCYDYLFVDLRNLAVNSTVQIETKIKFYIRAKRKQILRIEEQNKQILSLIQRIDDPTEYEVIKLYYFGNNPRKNPRRDIADEMCYDEAYVSQIKNKALKHLSEKVQAEELEGLLQAIR